MPDLLADLNEQIAYIDHTQHTDIMGEVHAAITAVNLEKAGLSQSEYTELLADRLSLIQLDQLLAVDEDMRVVQAALNRLPGLISSLVFA